jgi:FixJ family two-component response regulator
MRTGRGAIAFLDKPFEDGRLIAHLQSALQSRND